jgi:hypothetical protein
LKVNGFGGRTDRLLTVAAPKSVVAAAEPSALASPTTAAWLWAGIESRPEPCERPRVQWCLATPGAPGVFSLRSADSERDVQAIQPHLGPVLVDVEEQYAL